MILPLILPSKSRRALSPQDPQLLAHRTPVDGWVPGVASLGPPVPRSCSRRCHPKEVLCQGSGGQGPTRPSQVQVGPQPGLDTHHH